MKTQTLLIIIASCVAIIAFAGLIIYGIASEKGNEKGINIWKKLGETMVIIFSYIVFVGLNSTGKSYSDGFDQERRFSEMHNLPKLDSTMM